MQNKELTHEESLQVIQGMITLAKHKMNDTGFHFILWGVLVILASMTQYLIAYNGITQLSHWVWVVMPVIGIPIAYGYEHRKEKRVSARTKFDKMYGYLWLGFGLTLVVSIFVSLSNGSNPIPFILLLVGLVTFVSGAIYPFKPLIIGAFGFWIAAAVSSQVGDQNQLLINALAIFIGYIIPGYLLWKRSKTSENV
jgi:hypothetical protein